MSRKRNAPRAVSPRFEEPEDPQKFDHLRNSLPGQHIDGIQPDVLGYGRWGNNREREDTVVLGHPEVSGQYTTEYDRRDKYLGDLNDAPTRREDLQYVGPEEIRRRSKDGSPFG